MWAGNPTSSTLCAVSLTALLILGACSGATQQAGVSSDRIVVTKLPQSIQGESAYQIVQRYRSSWLRGRGRSSINAPQEVSVYLEGGRTRYGGPESLRDLSGRNVTIIEHLSAQEAQFQFGMDNTQGVILVHMKDGS